MVARTGWDEHSVIAQMRVNIYNFIGHQHLDAGSFEIYYKGPLAIHSGVYQGVNGAYGSPHHTNYYQRTIAHNSMLIYDPEEKFSAGRKQLDNDGGQRLPNNWTSPRNLENMLSGTHKTGAVLTGSARSSAAFTYLKGDLTASYSAKVREVKRWGYFEPGSRRGSRGLWCLTALCPLPGAAEILAAAERRGAVDRRKHFGSYALAQRMERQAGQHHAAARSREFEYCEGRRAGQGVLCLRQELSERNRSARSRSRRMARGSIAEAGRGCRPVPERASGHGPGQGKPLVMDKIEATPSVCGCPIA
jgi:hypothetical protein